MGIPQSVSVYNHVLRMMDVKVAPAVMIMLSKSKRSKMRTASGHSPVDGQILASSPKTYNGKHWSTYYVAGSRCVINDVGKYLILDGGNSQVQTHCDEAVDLDDLIRVRAIKLAAGVV